MSTCDVCMRDVDEGVSCADCIDTDFWFDQGIRAGLVWGAAIVAMAEAIRRFVERVETQEWEERCWREFCQRELNDRLKEKP